MVRWEGFEPPTLWFVASNAAYRNQRLAVFHYQKSCPFVQCFGVGLAAFFGKDLRPKMDATPALPLLSLVVSMALLWWAIGYLRR